MMETDNQFTEVGYRKMVKPAGEYGPVVLFFITYWFAGLIPATAVLVLSTVAALLVSYIILRKVLIMPLVTATIVVVFGGLTLLLQDETFIKMKPTIIQCILGLVLLCGLVLNKLFLKTLFGTSVKIDDLGWRILTKRFAILFFGIAALNEVVWRTQSTDFWVNFKVFGILGLTTIFLISQIPVLKRHVADKS